MQVILCSDIIHSSWMQVWERSDHEHMCYTDGIFGRLDWQDAWLHCTVGYNDLFSVLHGGSCAVGHSIVSQNSQPRKLRLSQSGKSRTVVDNRSVVQWDQVTRHCRTGCSSWVNTDMDIGSGNEPYSLWRHFSVRESRGRAMALNSPKLRPRAIWWKIYNRLKWNIMIITTGHVIWSYVHY